ncbi:MAG: hypothetical protein ACOH2T_29230 [Pseudomonas sp.]
MKQSAVGALAFCLIALLVCMSLIAKDRGGRVVFVVAGLFALFGEIAFLMMS